MKNSGSLYRSHKANHQIIFARIAREDLDAEKEPIVTCKLCHPAHHQSCLNENKQCTTWGCLATESDFA